MAQSITDPNNPSWSFITELLKYYKEFLETDFRSRFKPKRRIVLSRDEGLNGIALTKYQDLNDQVLELLSSKFKVSKLEKVDEGEFTIYPSDKAVEGIDGIVQEFGEFDEEKLLNAVLDNFERYLKNEKLIEVDNLLYSRSELRALLRGNPSKKYAAIIKKYRIFDFYRDINLLMQTKKLTDKTEFYLYFYEIKFDGESYPLLYIPLSIDVPVLSVDAKRYFELKFEDSPIIYVNEKALQYISEKLSESERYKLKIDLPKRQFYWNEIEDISGTFNDIFTRISNRFELPHFSLGKSNIKLENDNVKLTSTCYLTVFDKSDEAIVNDYEALMLMLEDDSSVARELFDGLINGFLLENPDVVTSEVDDEFEKLSPNEKLTYRSPISLNSEQIKILEALRNDRVKNVIVEGPPGTGKSHTISAIIYDALLNERSVLVVSDKKEALDVVEDKITDLLEKVKVDDSFVQNPILRLGQSDNNFHKIFQVQNFEKIKERYNAHKFNHKKTQEEINRTIAQMQSEISDELRGNKMFFDHIIELVHHNCVFESDKLNSWKDLIDIDELSDDKNYELLEDLYDALSDFKNINFDFSLVSSTWLSDHADDSSVNNLGAIIVSLERIQNLLNNLKLKDKFKYIYSLILDENGIAWDSLPVLLDKLKGLTAFLKNNESQFLLQNFISELALEDIAILQNEVHALLESFARANLLYKNHISKFSKYHAKDLTEKNIQHLEEYINEINRIKSFLWTLTKKSQIDLLNQKLQFAFPSLGSTNAHNFITPLHNEMLLGKEVLSLKDALKNHKLFMSSLLDLKNFNSLFTNSRTDEVELSLNQLLQELNTISKLIEQTKEINSYKNLLPLNSNRLTQESLELLLLSLELSRCVESIEYSLIALNLSPVEVSVIENPNHTDFLNIEKVNQLYKKFKDILEIVEYLQDQNELVESITDISEELPLTFNKLGIDIQNVSTYKTNKLISKDREEVKELIGYLKSLNEVNNFFAKNGPSNYSLNRKLLQNRFISNMTYVLDEKVVRFRTEHQNDATQIRNIIKSKGQIPKKHLRTLVEAFPCLIVNIRELGEYLPLEPQLFDIVIIDEASQVSIAQAFPALLRAKKVVVLGDTKQFSNVKTATASIPLNNEAFSKVKETFTDNLKALDSDTRDAIKDNIYRFDIKNSILSFMQSVSNYQTMLLKHFRGYREIIDYSNHYFYADRLQVMKLRGVGIQDVISFIVVEDTPDVTIQKGATSKILNNANANEARYIIEELEKLASTECKLTVGVITPFKNQQQYLYEELKKSPYFNYIEER